MITPCSAFNSHTQSWTKCETDTLVTLNIHSFEMCCHLITTKAMCLRVFIPLYYEALNPALRQRHCSAIKLGKEWDNYKSHAYYHKIGHINRNENDLCTLTQNWDSEFTSKFVMLAMWQVPNHEPNQTHI